jgi:hypothetical protein
MPNVETQTEVVKMMSYEELFSLFKHIDESTHKKETLFLGVSLATVPAVFASWDKLTIFPLALAAVASICFYWLHGLHIERYAVNQTKIVSAIKAQRSNFADVFDVSPSLSIRKLRSQFRWVLVVFWVFVCVARVVAG